MAEFTLEELDRLEKVARAAAAVAPGSWDRDAEKNEGEYGSAPDSREGFSSWFAHDEEGRRLFDAYNADVISVVEEWDEDGGSAIDVDGGKVIEFATTFDPPTVLRMVDRLRALEAAVAGVADDYMTSEQHHPDHVLIPAAKFEALRSLNDAGQVVLREAG